MSPIVNLLYHDLKKWGQKNYSCNSKGSPSGCRIFSSNSSFVIAATSYCKYCFSLFKARAYFESTVDSGSSIILAISLCLNPTAA